MPGAALIVILIAVSVLSRISKSARQTANAKRPPGRTTAGNVHRASPAAPAGPAPAPAAAPGPAPQAARPGPAYPRRESAFETFDVHEGPPEDSRRTYSETPRTADEPSHGEVSDAFRSGELLRAVVMSEVLKRPIERRRIPYARR